MKRHKQSTRTGFFAIIAIAVPLFAYADFDAVVPPAQDVAAVCTQQKNLAASRGRPDISNVFDNPTGVVLKDTCVAAVINPAVAHPNPKDPNTYMCVGKRARINITLAGLLTNTNVPDATVPAGKCETTSCSDSGGGLSCFAANEPTSLFGEAAKFLNSFQSFFGMPAGGGEGTPINVGIRG
jgi:hypothetical protein